MTVLISASIRIIKVYCCLVVTNNAQLYIIGFKVNKDAKRKARAKELKLLRKATVKKAKEGVPCSHQGTHWISNGVSGALVLVIGSLLVVTFGQMVKASVEEKLRSHPFAKVSKTFSDDIPVSSSPAEFLEHDTGIVMLTLPESSDEYHTPPDHLCRSETSSIEGQILHQQILQLLTPETGMMTVSLMNRLIRLVNRLIRLVMTTKR
ncbi:hypothetical protein E3N88_07863 [Mikania micrantha]|uniref:Uncharacterized protein n=1 Tax=Mikania micrantha TaxID=192012 RepID=A0A5N6PFP4_9ASTR|nr:hypothetical protein E3N88_07863 [Mikania micrantha]